MFIYFNKSNIQSNIAVKSWTKLHFIEKDIVLVMRRQLGIKIVLEGFGTKPQIENHHTGKKKKEEERVRE